MGLLKRIAEAKLSSYALEFEDWEKALRGACQKLIAEGYIDDRYVQAIIGNVKKYGPYIIIAPGIAMPHSAEKSEGVFKTAVSFMKVEKPVYFDKNDSDKYAHLFFTLASENHDEHSKNMTDLTALLTNSDIINDLLKVTCDDDLLKIDEKL